MSAPVDGYNGKLTELIGLASESKAKSNSFQASSANGKPTQGTLGFHFSKAPVEGAVVEERTDALKNQLIDWAELDSSPLQRRQFNCTGPTTFDSVAGSLVKFHYVLKCVKAPGASGVGGVTITGTGVTNLK